MHTIVHTWLHRLLFSCSLIPFVLLPFALCHLLSATCSLLIWSTLSSAHQAWHSIRPNAGAYINVQYTDALPYKHTSLIVCLFSYLFISFPLSQCGELHSRSRSHSVHQADTVPTVLAPLPIPLPLPLCPCPCLSGLLSVYLSHHVSHSPLTAFPLSHGATFWIRRERNRTYLAKALASAFFALTF